MVLSVVIVTFNNRAEIGACLDALTRGLAPFQSRLFVIDNASVDGTAEWLNTHKTRYQTQFNDFSLLCNPENTGFTAAVNQGLRQCQGQGDLILLLNPDVIVQENTLPVLAEKLLSRPEIGVITPQLRYLNGDIQASCRRFPRKQDVFLQVTGLSAIVSRLHLRDWKMSDFDHRTSRFVEQPQGAFLLFHQAVLERVGLLDEDFFMFFSDVEWCERVQQRGWRIWFSADTFVYHHKGASVSRHRARMLVTSHRSFVDYFAKKDRTLSAKIGTKIVMFILIMALWPRLILAHWGTEPA